MEFLPRFWESSNAKSRFDPAREPIWVSLKKVLFQWVQGLISNEAGFLNPGFRFIQVKQNREAAFLSCFRDFFFFFWGMDPPTRISQNPNTNNENNPFRVIISSNQTYKDYFNRFSMFQAKESAFGTGIFFKKFGLTPPKILKFSLNNISRGIFFTLINEN